MINESLNIIAAQLNEHLKNTFKTSEDKVIVSNLVNSDGTIPSTNENKIVVTLVNIKQEALFTNIGINKNSSGSSSLNTNLYIMFAANFLSYSESLKFIYATSVFLQENNSFPVTEIKAKKIQLEVVQIDYNGLNNLWSYLGTKYLPSLNYKLSLA